MEKKNSQQLTNFWFGFILGGLSLLTASYFFGTKQGRKNLQQLLVFFENWEENLELLIEKNEEKKSKEEKSSTPLITGVIEKIKTLSNPIDK
jgi:hypothetical protein